MTEAAPAAGAIGRLKLYYERNEQRIAVLSFVCGFLFDILMVDRADSWEAIGQQVLYLAVILAALTQMFLEEGKPPLETATVFFVKRWYYRYRTAVVHFFLGTLLNVYTPMWFRFSSVRSDSRSFWCRCSRAACRCSASSGGSGGARPSSFRGRGDRCSCRWAGCWSAFSFFISSG